MIGNAVPVKFAKQLASVIYKDVSEYLKLHQTQSSEIVEKKKEEKVFVSQEVEKDLFTF